MKKIIAILLVMSFAFGALSFGNVTDKVDKLIATNQANLERTYYPRDMRPNQLAVQLGAPLYLGAEYTYNMMPSLGVQLGIGSLITGVSTNVGLIYYILPTTFTPYVNGGINYYGDFSHSVIAGNIGAGVDIALDNALTIQLGVDWVKSISNTDAPFQNTVWNTTNVNWVTISAGLGFRM